MKKVSFLIMLLVLVMGLSLNAQTSIVQEQEKPKEASKVLAVSSLEIFGPENFNMPDANAISESLSTVFSGILANYRIPGIEIGSRTSEKIIKEEGKTIYSYDYDESTGAQGGKFLRADYLLQGKIIAYSSGTVLFTAQIIDAESNTIAASIKSGYKKVNEVEELLALVDDMTYELLDNFKQKLSSK